MPARCCPGLLLAVLYLVYTMVRVWLNPKLGPPLSDEELDVPPSHVLREFFARPDAAGRADPRHARLDRHRLGHADRGRGARLRRRARS